MNKRKILSYIIDLIIIGILSTIIDKCLVLNDVNIYRQELSNISLDRIANDVNIYNFMFEFGRLQQKIDQANILNTMISMIATSNIVIFIPYFLNNQTIGQMIMKIKMESTKNGITMKDLICRTIILYGYGVLLVSLITMYILPNPYYFLLMCALSLGQIIILLVSFIRMTKDMPSLQDIIGNIEIINDK